MNRIKKVIVLCVFAAVVLTPVFAAAETYKIDPNHSQVGFTIKHLVSRVQGHFNTFSAEIVFDPENIPASKVTAEIDTGSIDTGNPKRDGHLKSPDFFNAEKNPKLTFTSTGVTSSGKDQMKVAGNLTMNSVTKPVTLDVKFLGSTADPMGPPGGKRAGFEGKTTVNRKDFNIIWNKALDAGGFLLGDDVDVTLLVEAASAAPAPAKPAADAKPAPAKPGK